MPKNVTDVFPYYVIVYEAYTIYGIVEKDKMFFA